MKAGFYGVCSCQGLFQQDLKFKKEEIMKKWMVLMLAVGFVLTASFSAQADSVLLPWIVKNNTVSTIVTLVNTANPDPTNDEKVRFHLMYWYKASTQNLPNERCEEVDFCVPTSFNDILVFDAAGNINRGAPLFGDTSVQGTKYTTVQGDALSLPADAPRRAFLIATNEIYTNESCGVSRLMGGEDTVYAEAMVVDIATGAAWGYDGYNPRNESSWLDFSDNATRGTDALGQIVASDRGEYAFLTIMPPSVLTTRLFVTPVYNDMIRVGTGQHVAVAVQLYCDIGNNLGGMYDYDERCISFNTARGIVCTDGSDVSTYVSSGAWTIFANTRAEGWAYLFLPPNRFVIPSHNINLLLPTTQQAAIGKLEFTVSGTSIDGTRIGGAFNNFIWLRSRLSSQED
jgi:hypothetical protein